MGSVQRRTNQGGSVANYIIIGVILSVGLGVAVYTLNQRGQQARKDQAIAEFEKKQAADKLAKNDEKEKVKEEKATTDESLNTTVNNSIPSDSLPVTGIDLAYSDYLIIYLLVSVSVAYLMSRRTLIPLAK